MRFYGLGSKFTFGRFKGKTVREVIKIDHTYIMWCVFEIYNFYIVDEVIEEMKSIVPNFSISEKEQMILSKKSKSWEEFEDDYINYSEYDFFDNYDYDSATFDALTDGQYGSYNDFRENGGDLDSLSDGLGF